MTTVAESQNAKHGIASALSDGVDQISESQLVQFRRYMRVILPVDGSVFWVLDQTTPAFTEAGSLHFTIIRQQNEDETVSINRMTLTAKEQIAGLNDIGPMVMYIGQVVSSTGEPYGEQFGFSQKKSFYKQAGLWHYVGDAVYPSLQTQVVDTLGDILTQEPVVSNSLPFWLALNDYMPMYASFLVTPNLVPPYASVHIAPEWTTAIQAIAAQDPVWNTANGVITYPLASTSTNRNQLVKDKVKVTLWGLRNSDAQMWLDYVIDFMTNSPDLGLMNTPVIRDEKKTQAEQTVIGIKKSIEFEVSYHQSRAVQIAQQLIQSTIQSYSIGVA